MPIIRSAPRYTVVPNSVIEDRRLSWGARGLLIYHLSKPDNWDGGVPHFERELGRSLTADERNEFHALLVELRAAGYATFEPTYDQHGRFDRGIWTIGQIDPVSEQRP